jgi:hypothetical protein
MFLKMRTLPVFTPTFLVKIFAIGAKGEERRSAVREIVLRDVPVGESRYNLLQQVNTVSARVTNHLWPGDWNGVSF